jgi:hypothetical protein
MPAFLKELTRIAPRGYLEFPTFLYEYLYGFDVHLNLLYWDGQIIHGCSKAESGMERWRTTQRFFYRTLENGFEKMIQDYKTWFVQGFEWENQVPFQHNPQVHQLKIPLPEKPVASPSLQDKPKPSRTRFLDPFRSVYHKLTRKPAGSIANDADYIEAFSSFKNTANGSFRSFSLKWENRMIVRGENTSTTHFDTHYIYHPAWAMRVLKELNPPHHNDFGSILSFPTQLSSILPVTYFDVRPASLILDGLTAVKADLTSLDIATESLQSVSCMHVIEHIGLGRYGDTIDFNGDLKAISELQRVTKAGGTLLLVVPVGKPQIIFNAHRIYSFEQIADVFKGWKMLEFALIPDNALETGILRHADPALVSKQTYACGCFHFQKESPSK